MQSVDGQPTYCMLPDKKMQSVDGRPNEKKRGRCRLSMRHVHIMWQLQSADQNGVSRLVHKMGQPNVYFKVTDFDLQAPNICE